jgi:hypothetical protein
MRQNPRERYRGDSAGAVLLLKTGHPGVWSGLATGEQILLDDRMDAPIPVNHLGDAEIDASC